MDETAGLHVYDPSCDTFRYLDLDRLRTGAGSVLAEDLPAPALGPRYPPPR